MNTIKQRIFHLGRVMYWFGVGTAMLGVLIGILMGYLL